MKSITYARLTLLTPYPIIIVSLLAFIYSYARQMAGYTPGMVDMIIGMTFGMVLYTALLWLVPYTILAIGLLVWSIGKSFQQFKIAYISSPIFFAVLCALFFVVIGVTAPAMGEADIILETAMVIFTASMLAILMVCVGYLFVGLSILIHKGLFQLKLIRD